MRFGKVDVRYLGALLGLASLLLVIFSAVTRQGTDWWAAWGQWVGGVGSIAAAGVALWIAQKGWTIARDEAKEREALKFAVWAYSQDSVIATVAYLNTTALPVYDVVVTTKVEEFSFRFALGTASPTSRTGETVANMTHRLTDAVKRVVLRRLGEAAYYATDEDGN